MRVAQISNCNSTNHYQSRTALPAKKVYGTNSSVSFHGNTKGVFASIGSAIAGFFAYINSIGKHDYKEDESDNNKLNIPTERYPGEDSPYPNGDWPDTAF